MLTLIKVNEKFHRKDICTALNIRGAFQPSCAQREYRSLHKPLDGSFNIKETENGYQMSSSKDNKMICEVSKNRNICNKSMCTVTCFNCPSGHCMHEFVCTCDWYAFRNMCSHLHIASQICTSTSERNHENEQTTSSWLPSSDQTDLLPNDRVCISGQCQIKHVYMSEGYGCVRLRRQLDI